MEYVVTPFGEKSIRILDDLETLQEEIDVEPAEHQAMEFSKTCNGAFLKKAPLAATSVARGRVRL